MLPLFWLASLLQLWFGSTSSTAKVSMFSEMSMFSMTINPKKWREQLTTDTYYKYLMFIPPFADKKLTWWRIVLLLIASVIGLGLLIGLAVILCSKSTSFSHTTSHEIITIRIHSKQVNTTHSYTWYSNPLELCYSVISKYCTLLCWIYSRNSTILKVVINLITNTVNVQH